MPGQLGALRLISLIDQLGAIHSKSSHTNLAQVLLAVLSVRIGKGVITCHSKRFGSAQSSSPHTDLESKPSCGACLHIAAILQSKLGTPHTHAQKNCFSRQCSLQGIVSLGTDGKPATVRQHINS